MKNLLSSIFFLLITAGSCFAQDKTIAVAKNAFQTANITSLSHYLHAEVAVIVENDESIAGKSATENELKSFFAKHAVTHFEFIHQGSSKDGKVFVVGKYECADGSYRIRLNLKNYGNEYLIDSIDLGKE